MKKSYINLIIITATFVALFVLVFCTSGFNDAVNLFMRMKYGWILAAFCCMVVYWAGDAVVLHIITTNINRQFRFRDSFKISMIGAFFSSITPFASGGQPAQAYIMVKNGVKAGHAASIIVVKSITHQAVIVIYSLIVIIFRGSFFISKIPEFFYFYLLGFFLNSLVVVMYVLIIYKRDVAYKITMFLFGIINKVPLLKKLKKYEDKLERELEYYGHGSDILKNNSRLLVKTTLVQIIKFTFFFSIPYLIFISIEGFGKINMWDMVAAQSIITMIASYIPSPGSAGAAEGTGYIFFSLFFKTGTIAPVILIWRMITYYSSVVFGGLVSMIVPEKPLKSS